MAGEVSNTEESTEFQTGDHILSGEEDLSQTAINEVDVTELQSLVAQKDEELSEVNARITELEQVLTGKNDEIGSLKQLNEELEERLVTVDNTLTDAVAGYRAVLVQANPDVIEELITGDTIEAVNESLDKAKALVSKVREGLETEMSLARVPAGAPERTAPDFSGLSPREKIQQAIAIKR